MTRSPVRKVLGLVVLSLSILLGWMAWRAHALGGAVAPGTGLALASAPTIDGALVAEHLAAALRAQTVSRTEHVVDSPAAFAELRALFERTYPKTHATLSRELVAEHSLLYTWKGSDPSLPPVLLLAHQDVVPVEPGTESGWDAPPFSGEIRDGHVYGRGAMDDKGSLVALFEAIEALLGTGFTPRRTVILAFGHDEETQGHGAQAMAALLKQRGVHAWFVLDEGMTIVRDFPLTKAPAALIGIAEKGYLTVRVTAKGQGGHSSTPPKDTAAERLSRAILALRAKPFARSLDHGPVSLLLEALAPGLGFVPRLAIANRWLFGPLLAAAMGAEPAGAALVGTTIAPTMIDGGAKENVLPQEMHAIVNLRLHPRDRVGSALEHLRSSIAGIEGVSLEPIGTPTDPSPLSSTTGPAYALIAAAAREHAPPGTPVAPMLVLGATDSRHYAQLADDVYRFNPAWIHIADRVRVHGTNERISLENLARMAHFYAVLVATACR